MMLLVHLLAFCAERQKGTEILYNQTTQTFSSEDKFGNTAGLLVHISPINMLCWWA